MLCLENLPRPLVLTREGERISLHITVYHSTTPNSTPPNSVPEITQSLVAKYIFKNWFLRANAGWPSSEPQPLSLCEKEASGRISLRARPKRHVYPPVWCVGLAPAKGVSTRRRVTITDYHSGTSSSSPLLLLFLLLLHPGGSQLSIPPPCPSHR